MSCIQADCRWLPLLFCNTWPSVSSGQRLVSVLKDAAEVGGGPEDKQDSRASGLPQAAAGVPISSQSHEVSISKRLLPQPCLVSSHL